MRAREPTNEQKKDKTKEKGKQEGQRWSPGAPEGLVPLLGDRSPNRGVVVRLSWCRVTEVG